MSDVIYFGYSSQIDFIDDFMSNYLDDNEALIIRMHPNMTNVDQAFRDSFYENVNKYKKKNVFLVKSHENISSLRCVELSNIVFGFGTTVCIEAALLGKPVISLCNRPWSKFFDYELVDLINLKQLVTTIENGFCKVNSEQRASRYIYTLHKWLGDNPLVSNAKSKFFANLKIHFWFRLMNYLYRRLVNYRN